jgi:hypothetical protein
MLLLLLFGCFFQIGGVDLLCLPYQILIKLPLVFTFFIPAGKEQRLPPGVKNIGYPEHMGIRFCPKFLEIGQLFASLEGIRMGRLKLGPYSSSKRTLYRIRALSSLVCAKNQVS